MTNLAVLQRPAQDDLRGVAAGLVCDAVYDGVGQHRILVHAASQPLRPKRAIPLSTATRDSFPAIPAVLRRQE